jgi:P27 family predicted phage terminase small subunit
MQGRKPKPTHLKLVTGNPGKRDLNLKEPKPRLSLPTVPDHLNEWANAEWLRVSQELFDLGILTRLDRAILAAYCGAYGRWVQAEKELAKEPLVVLSATGLMKQHPLIGISNTAQREMRAFASELGLSPASRSRVKAEPVNDKTDKTANFFKG